VTGTSDDTGRLQCAFCGAYEVDRLYLGSLRLDSCECQSCGARWDEDLDSGDYKGRGTSASAITPRER
jgi:hypothetical protein